MVNLKILNYSKNYGKSRFQCDDYQALKEIGMLQTLIIISMLIACLSAQDVQANGGAVYTWNMQGATALRESKYNEITTKFERADRPDVVCLQETGNMPSLYEAMDGEIGSAGRIYTSNQHFINNFEARNLAYATRNGNVLYTGIFLNTTEQRNGLAIFVNGDILEARAIVLPNNQKRPALLVRANVCGTVGWYATLHLNSGRSQELMQQQIVQDAVDAILNNIGMGNADPVNIIGDYNLDFITNAPPNPAFGQYVGVNGITRPSPNMQNGGTMLDFLYTTQGGPHQLGTVISSNGTSDHQIVCYQGLNAGGQPPNDSTDNSPGDVVLVTRTFSAQADANTFYNGGQIYYTGITTFIPLEPPTCLPDRRCQVRYLAMEADLTIDVSNQKSRLESKTVSANNLTIYQDINFEGRAVQLSPSPFMEDTYCAEAFETLGFASTGLRATSSIKIESGIMVKFYDDDTNVGLPIGGFLFRNDSAMEFPDLTNTDICRSNFNCPLLSSSAQINDLISSLAFKNSFTVIHITLAGVADLGSTLDLGYLVNQNADVPPESTISWASSDESLATVDANGVITTNETNTGTTEITAVLNPGNQSVVSYTLRVTEAQFTPDRAAIKTGETLDLNNRLTINPNAVRQELIWTSADTTLATVDENGLVTANNTNVGTTTITAGVEYGGFEVSLQLTVTNVCQVDFDFDDKGNPLQPGAILNHQYTDFKVQTTSNQRWPMLFNTANPTSNDFDIGTPNKAYGGKGIGAGGVGNRLAQGNALVVSKHATIPNETEGRLIFEFNEPVTIQSVDLIDMKCGDSNIGLYNQQNELINNLPIPAYGVNSFNTFNIEAVDVKTMAINLLCGGGISGFRYCKTSTACTTEPDCKPAELLNFIVGDDYVIARFDNPGRATIAFSQTDDTNFKSIETKIGMNYIGGFESCTDYQLKTSITCSNGQIKESALRKFTTDDCNGFNKNTLFEDSPVIQLAPNPVSDFLNITYASGDKQQLLIYDTTGKKVETIQTGKSGEVTLDVSHYTPGVYIIISSGSDKVLSEKFLVR